MPCSGTPAADVVFVLDASSSTGSDNFEKMKDFLKSFVDDFDIGPDTLNVGVVIFYWKVEEQFWLNTHTNKPDLLDAITSMTYPGSHGTFTHKVLDFVRENFNQVRFAICSLSLSLSLSLSF